jgi:predicted metal-dependent phosphoesterase TrpH
LIGVKGALHIHTTYSDGDFTLREVRDIYAAAGCSFACVTDHAESFDEERLRAYVAECAALSDDRFRLIPGLEYGCERKMHVLGYGVTKLAGTTDPEAVIRHIDSAGGVSVIAHPKDSAFEWIETFATLPQGVETWNTKYDGRYAPRPRTFALLDRLRARRPGMLAFYGQDLHWRGQYTGLFTVVRADSLSAHAVVRALAAGAYHAVKGDLLLPASGSLPESLLERFDQVHRRSTIMREWVKRVRRMYKRFGASVPAPIKKRLRKIF